MPPTPQPPTRVRPSDVVNAAIRALWIGPGGHPTVQLNAERRAEYEQLRYEWTVAVAAERGVEVVEAA